MLIAKTLKKMALPGLTSGEHCVYLGLCATSLVSGDARIVNNRGSITLTLTIDVVNQTVFGTVDGKISGIVVSDNDREKISVTLSGPVTGSYKGSDTSGSFRGSASIVQSGTGGTARGRGHISGTMSQHRVRCKLLLAEQEFTFKFPVEEE